MSQLHLLTDESRGADISKCKRYRYAIWRSWGKSDRWVNFILLNPSTADATVNDPTLRRCMNYASSWGYDGVFLTNLYALRSTKPEGLLTTDDPVGPENDEYLARFARRSSVVVCGWGVQADQARPGRQAEVLEILERAKIAPRILHPTKAGFPQHPLYLSKGLFYRIWKPEERSAPAAMERVAS